MYRIEVPATFGMPGAFVMIRPKRSWAAINRLQTAGMVVHAVVGEKPKDGATSEVTVDAVDRGLAVLESIASWSGVKGMSGELLEATKSGFLSDDFDPDFGDWLVDEINAFYDAQKRPADEGKTGAPSSPEL